MQSTLLALVDALNVMSVMAKETQKRKDSQLVDVNHLGWQIRQKPASSCEQHQITFQDDPMSRPASVQR